MTVGLALSGIGVAAWCYLLGARGGFWRAGVREEAFDMASPSVWPPIAAVVPARKEAGLIGQSVTSLLLQDYPVPLRVIVVDDQSDDGTSAAASAAAEKAKAWERLTVISGTPLPPGWTGKLWAMKQGVDFAQTLDPPCPYLLLTDADIAYDQAVIRNLAARAVNGELALASLMVRLRCESFAERALIPAFVFFFQMLYPFAWVNRRDHPMAAAAGGCMLVRADALTAAGGVASIKSSLIDDCALGRALKKQGPIWLGLTSRAHSLRAYGNLAISGAWFPGPHTINLIIRPSCWLELSLRWH